MATILVVDDLPVNRLVLARMLTAKGHKAIQVGDGYEALRLADELRPAMILLDMSMNGLDGWTVTRRIKSDPQLAHIPVIAVTAHCLQGDRERTLAVGCDDYVPKPVDYDDLMKAITAHLAA